MNSSTGVQDQFFESVNLTTADLKTEFPQFSQSSNLSLVLAWKREGLDPLKQHSISFGLDDASSERTQLIFDYMIVTTTQFEPG